ncbi:MAG: acyltransferase [Planctomycetota bacterium]
MSVFKAHPTAVIDQPAAIGDGTRIWHFSHVMSGAVIGKDCVLGQNVYVGARALIGNGVKIQNNCSIYDAVTLADESFIGPSVVFTNVMNPRAFVVRKDQYRPTLVERGATIGANATIVCGVTIGPYAFVAAGSVVARDVPAYGLVMGVPARLKGWVCRCGVHLPAGIAPVVCAECGRRYRTGGGACAEEGPQ